MPMARSSQEGRARSMFCSVIRINMAGQIMTFGHEAVARMAAESGQVDRNQADVLFRLSAVWRQAVRPPSAMMSAPVTKAASRLARKATTAAISRGWP